MLWIFLSLNIVAAFFLYVADAILDVILKTMSKNISKSTTISGMLIKTLCTLKS